MAAGLGLLRLPPQVFWAMTPRELAAALAWHTGSATLEPLTRADFHDLRALFPDIA